MKTLVWRRLDAPGMEVAHVRSLDEAHGTQIGVDYELRWELLGDGILLNLSGVRRAGARLEGADFFDVFASPFFNTLPVLRDGLLDGGAARDYVMKFVNVPSLEIVRSTQRYEPLGNRVVRYSSGDFTADIEFGADGFVTLYHGFLERLS